MDTIDREIYVTRDTVKVPIDITEGTNILPIRFVVQDYDVPVTAAAIAYINHQNFSKPKSILCDVQENMIVLEPNKTTFGEGKNEVQIRIINDEKNLISFKETVRCKGKMRMADEEEESQPTLVEQILKKVGTEEGERKTADVEERTAREKADDEERSAREKADQDETNERKKADQEEQIARKKEIAIERQRINSRCITKCGTIVIDIPTKSDSVRVFSNGDIDSLLGVSGSSNANTSVFFSNGDGQMTLHVEGATYLNNAWYATFNGLTTEITKCRLNYLVARDGNLDADTSGTTMEVKTQEKTVTPGTTKQMIYPDPGYDYLTQVTVEEIPYKESTQSGATTVQIG